MSQVQSGVSAVVGARGPLKPWQWGVLAAAVVAAAFIVPVVLRAVHTPKQADHKEATAGAGEVGRPFHPVDLTGAAIIPIASNAQIAREPPRASPAAFAPSGPDPVQDGVMSPLRIGGSKATQAGAPSPASDVDGLRVAGAAAAPGASPLGDRLRATATPPVNARRLPFPDWTIAEGTVIPCVLSTAVDSSYPGFVTAVLPKDVWSMTHTNILLDHGTKVFGSIEQGMINGLDRLFILWREVTTPDGVRIDLDSPAADAIGNTGLAGDVNRHLLQKVGGILALSLIDGGLQAGLQAASGKNANGGSGSFYQFNSSGDQSGTLLLGSVINIPDVMTINQGARCGIFTARDLVFNEVYQNVVVAP